MTAPRFAAVATLIVAGALGAPADAQVTTVTKAAAPPAQPASTLDALNASYAQQHRELDRRKLADLTALAARQPGPDAEAAYRELFGMAIGQDLYAEAEPAARRYMAAPAEPTTDVLATFIALIARAGRGEYDQSIADLEAFFKSHPAPADGERTIAPEQGLALGEAYLQRLIHAGRYDIARRVCELATERVRVPSVRDHFRQRLTRLAMVGRPAPAVVGKDVDGKEIGLADFKGKVVLVDFWATWCPPCVAEVPTYSELRAKYQGRGFEILGVNVDSEREDLKDDAKVKPIVKGFLLNYRVAWPNVLNNSAGSDVAKAYQVESIPANFLIDREGKIVAFELTGADLDRAIEKALGAAPAAR